MRTSALNLWLFLLQCALVSMAHMQTPEAVELPTYRSDTPPDNCVYRTLAGLLPRCLTPPKPYSFTGAAAGISDDDDELNIALTDTERVYYAIGLSLCQFVASSVAVPTSCPAALKLMLPSSSSGGGTSSTNIEKCLTALRASPQLWATYSGYYQTVGRLCAEQAPLHQRDRLLRAQARVAAAHEAAAARLHEAIARAADDVWALVHAQAAARVGALVADVNRRLERVHSEIDAVSDGAWELRAAHAGLAESQRQAGREANALAGQIQNLTENALNSSTAIAAAAAAAAAAAQSYGFGSGLLGLVVTLLIWAARAVSQVHLIVFVVGLLALMRQRLLSSAVMGLVAYLLVFIAFPAVLYSKSNRDNNFSSRGITSSSGRLGTLELWTYFGRVALLVLAATALTGRLVRATRATTNNLLNVGDSDAPASFLSPSARLFTRPPDTEGTAFAAATRQSYNHKLCRIYQTMH